MVNEEKIAQLKAEIKAEKLKGSFKGLYVKIRKGTVDINKNDITENQKKKALNDLIISIQNEIKADSEQPKGKR